MNLGVLMKCTVCIMAVMLTGCGVTPEKNIAAQRLTVQSVIGSWRAVESDFSDYKGEQRFYDIMVFKANGQAQLGSSLHREETQVTYAQDQQMIRLSTAEPFNDSSLMQAPWQFEVQSIRQLKRLVINTSQHKTVYIPAQQVLNERILGQWKPLASEDGARLRFLGNERFGLYGDGKRKAQGIYRLWDTGKRGLRLSLLLTLENSGSAGMLNYRALLTEQGMRITPLQNGSLIHEAEVVWQNDGSL